jgi:hypothetical protein
LLAASLTVVVLAVLGAVFIGARPTTPGALPGAPPAPSAHGKTAAEGRLPMIDTHVHLQPDGGPRLLALMKKYGFDHVVNLSGGNPLGVLPAQLAMASTLGGRVTEFTTLGYEQSQRPGYGQRMAQLVRMGHDMGAKGLKIAKALGLGMRDPDGRLIPVDDPELDVVFETAGELNMPIAIHTGDPRAFWQPVDEHNERYAELKAHPGWAIYGRKDVPSFDEMGAALERRIARHPKTKFISVHFGNCAEDIDRVATMMRKYPNMYIDTAARIPEMGRHPVEKLRAFFFEFQDRILYGSDLGISAEPDPLFLGSSGPNPPTPAEEDLFFNATHRFFETADTNFPGPTPIQGSWNINGIHLPRDVLAKVYAKNAMSLIGIELPTLVQ